MRPLLLLSSSAPTQFCLFYLVSTYVPLKYYLCIWLIIASVFISLINNASAFGPSILFSIATNTTISIVYLTFVATAPLVSQEIEGVVPRLRQGFSGSEKASILLAFLIAAAMGYPTSIGLNVP